MNTYLASLKDKTPILKPKPVRVAAKKQMKPKIMQSPNLDLMNLKESYSTKS